MGYGFAGSISPKAARRANARLARLRGTRAQASRMAAFDDKERDEGAGARAEIPAREINHPTNQRKGAAGRVSAGGGAGRESQVHANEIDAPRNGRKFPAGRKASGRPGGTPAAARGPVAPSGPLYGGGGQNTQ